MTKRKGLVLFISIWLISFFQFICLNAKTIQVAPNNKMSNSALIEALEKAAKLNGRPVTIQLQQGTYLFGRSEAKKELYYVSNTTSEKENPDPTKHIGVLIKHLKNVTIDGGGATLMMTGQMTSIVIDQCEGITLKNLNIDYLEPTQTELKVIDSGTNYITAKVHPTSKYKIDNGKLVWYGDGWSFNKGIAQGYDYEKDITWRTWSPMSGLIKTIELEPGLLRMSYNKNPQTKIGTVYQMRDGIRDEVSCFINRSKNVRLENVNFFFLGNFGVVGQYSENITFDSVNFEPEPGSGRTNAGFADFIQISGCRGLINITNSRFVGAHDDPINIHGTHLKVTEYLSDRSVKLKFMHDQSYGFDAFFKDDNIEFIDSNTLLSVSSAKVKNVQKINEREIVLTFDKDLSREIKDKKNLMIENVTWTPEVRISNNYFSRIPTRGILVTTRRKVLIENNTFFRMQMSGILISNDALSWYESGMVKDVTIRRNNFIECGDPVIFIEPENRVQEGYVHQNIKIQENRFKLNTPNAIHAKSVNGLMVKDNLFLIKEKPEKQESFVRTKDCVNVTIQNNRIE